MILIGSVSGLLGSAQVETEPVLKTKVMNRRNLMMADSWRQQGVKSVGVRLSSRFSIQENSAEDQMLSDVADKVCLPHNLG